jgi:ubiquinone/menaquinone biosynthesis C-methylase UbiE
MNQQLEYGNWVRKKKLVVLGLCTIVSGGLIFLPFGMIYCVSMYAVFLVFLVSFLFPFYSYFVFSHRGGDFQTKLFALVIQKLDLEQDGKVLEVGCGNGVLSVLLAKHFSDADVTGVDYWGSDWEYSKGVCEKNAVIAEVTNRVHFQKGDAASLDFSDGSFDGITSNLTFHEVQKVKDKKDVLFEALRVLKPGGAFSLVDYFYDPQYYGSQETLLTALQSWNLKNFDLHPLSEVMKLPFLMNHPNILGKVGILYGKK